MSCESKRVPSFNVGFSLNEIKANTATCKWVKHNINYESKLKNEIQSSASLRWGCFDDSYVYRAHCISRVHLKTSVHFVEGKKASDQVLVFSTILPLGIDFFF